MSRGIFMAGCCLTVVATSLAAPDFDKVSESRFTVSLPRGFEAHPAQVKSPVVRWTYTGRIPSENVDYRFRVSVVAGGSRLPEGENGLEVAGAMLVVFTSQQTRPYSEVRIGQPGEATIGRCRWVRQDWTGLLGKQSISGSFYMTIYNGVSYYLQFECASAAGAPGVRDAIIGSFQPAESPEKS